VIRDFLQDTLEDEYLQIVPKTRPVLSGGKRDFQLMPGHLSIFYELHVDFPLKSLPERFVHFKKFGGDVCHNSFLLLKIPQIPPKLGRVKKLDHR